MAARHTFKFVPTSGGAPVKRKQAARACPNCRKHKKRCIHLGPDESSSTLLGSPGVSRTLPLSEDGRRNHSEDSIRADLPDTIRNHRSGFPDHHDGCTDEDEHHGNSRYLGDLNPEVTFLEMESGDKEGTATQADAIGVWQSRTNSKQTTGRHSDVEYRSRRFSCVYAPNPVISTVLLPQIEQNCLALLPSSSDVSALLDIYWGDVQPLFPIIHAESFSSLRTSSFPHIILTQVICLAASASPRGKHHLRLSVISQHLLPRETFAGHLSLALLTVLNLGLIQDRVLYSQVSALLALSYYFAGDGNVAADICARSISSMHTLGLHLDIPEREHDSQLETQFCCLWALDRLNAAFLGRPVMIHERDVGRDLENSFQRQEPCFQLLLRTVLLLDTVIDLYRPSKKDQGINEISLPTFESLVDITASHHTKSMLLVCILSGRVRSFQNGQRSAEISARQQLSATSIRSIAAEDPQGGLSYLPIVPYAILLSLRVAYWELRTSKVPMLVARARKDLLVCCQMLHELGRSFWMVTPLAEQAEKTVREVERVVTHVTGRKQQVTTTGASNSPARGDLTEEWHPGRMQADSTPAVLAAQDGTLEEALDWDPGKFDSAAFENLSDLNIFERLDPDFDLGAIDAAFGDDGTFFNL